MKAAQSQYWVLWGPKLPLFPISLAVINKAYSIHVMYDQDVARKSSKILMCKWKLKKIHWHHILKVSSNIASSPSSLEFGSSVDNWNLYFLNNFYKNGFFREDFSIESIKEHCSMRRRQSQASLDEGRCMPIIQTRPKRGKRQICSIAGHVSRHANEFLWYIEFSPTKLYIIKVKKTN